MRHFTSMSVTEPKTYNEPSPLEMKPKARKLTPEEMVNVMSDSPSSSDQDDLSPQDYLEELNYIRRKLASIDWDDDDRKLKVVIQLDCSDEEDGEEEEFAII